MLALNKIPWVRISAYHVIPRFIFPGEICRDFSAEFPVNVPEKPKKPPTPYIRYFQENRSIFEREYPTANYRDIMKIASEKWRLCSPDIKKPYEEAYAKDKENYLHKRDSFENALTEDQQMVLEEMEDKARRKREKSKLKKGLKELGKPKTPPGSYALFFATKKGQKIPGESLREWGSRIGAEWKNMPEIEKQPYFEQAKALRLQYEKDIDSWRKEALQFKSENPVVKKAQRKLRLQEERQREKLFNIESPPELLATENAESDFCINSIPSESQSVVTAKTSKPDPLLTESETVSVQTKLVQLSSRNSAITKFVSYMSSFYQRLIQSASRLTSWDFSKLRPVAETLSGDVFQ